MTRYDSSASESGISRPTSGAAVLAMCACLALAACHRPPPTEIARELIEERRFDAAESILREAVEANPRDLALQLEYGSLLVSLKRWNQALWPLLRASAGEEFSAAAVPLVVRCLVQTSNHADAIAVMGRLLERNPDDVAIRQMRAHSLVANHEEEKALVDIDWLLDRDAEDDDFAILELKLRALLQLQRADEAQAALTELRGRPDSLLTPDRAPRLCAVDANFSAERGEADSARAKFDACLEEFPDDELVAIKAVSFHDSQGEVERATEILESALDERPDSLQLTKALSDRLRALGRADDALALLEGVGSEHRRAVAVFLAEHHMEMDDPASALKSLEWAYETESDEALFAALPDEQRFMVGDILVLLREDERVRRLIPHIREPAYRQFLEARMLFEAGRYGEALAEFDEGFRIWPSSPGPRFLAGQAAEQIGDFNAAIDHYRASVRSEAADSDAGIALARIYAAQGSWLAATEALQYHQQAHRRDAEALRMMAELHVLLGNKNVAAQIRGELSQLPGKRDIALADHARNLAAVESPSLALKFIEEQATDLLAPGYRETLAVWCEIMSGMGRAGEALQKLTSPDVKDVDSRLLALRAQTLVAMGSDSEARVILESIVAGDPDSSWGLLGLARLNAKLGRIDDAVALYDRASALDEEEPLAAFEAGRLLASERTGGAERRAEAEARLREALRREPTHGAAASILARIELRDGAVSSDLLALAERAARFAPGAESAQLLGEVHLARREHEAAVNALQRAIEAGAVGGRVHYMLARALTGTGDAQRAREELELSLESGPFEEAEAARVELARLGGSVRRDAM